MIALSVIPDRFNQQLESQYNGEIASKNTKTVRRPTRGTVLKEETFATMRVVTGNGKNILMTDAGGNYGTPENRATDVYSNFLLQNVAEQRMEKQQILETFGEPYIFFFGERPRMLQFSGVLLNTFDFNWEAEWWENYEYYLRGTRCVENDARVFLSYDETLVSGYIVDSAATKNANERNHVNFQFTMFLTGYYTISALGNGLARSITDIERAKKASLSNSDSIGEFNVQAPQQLVPGQVVTGSIVANAVQPPSLVQGLTTGLSSVVNTWNEAQSLVNSSVQQMSNLAKGDILRVPYGFTGSFAYDAVDLARVPQPTGDYGPLTYSEFNKNEDEYIGSSSHYGNAFIPALFGLTADDQIADQDFVVACADPWIELGFSPPVENLLDVSTILVNEVIGIFPVGNTTNWHESAPVDQALSALNLTPEVATRPPTRLPGPK